MMEHVREPRVFSTTQSAADGNCPISILHVIFGKICKKKVYVPIPYYEMGRWIGGPGYVRLLPAWCQRFARILYRALAVRNPR